MDALALVRIGEVEPRWLESLVEPLATLLGRPVRVDSAGLDPDGAYDGHRSQYDTRRLLPRLEEWSTSPGEAVLGVADVDLYSSIFTFVFGEAHLGGCCGLVSMHRLRPESYGLAPDPELLGRRLLTECAHEIGHMLGGIHCRTPDCVMGFSGAVEEIDLKGPAPCAECREWFVPPTPGTETSSHG